MGEAGGLPAPLTPSLSQAKRGGKAPLAAFGRSRQAAPMHIAPAEPDTDRFLADLGALRRIGAFRTGVHRPTYSPEDMESRRWLMDRMAEAGLAPEMDGVGNVLGRHPGPGP